jgi:hypothetical protein
MSGFLLQFIDNQTLYYHNGETYGSSGDVIIVPTKMIGTAILSKDNASNQLA